MGTMLTSYMNVVRTMPLGSAIDIPWQWMEDHKLTDASIILPTIDLNNENKILQTISRLFFAIILPSLARPVGFANLALGAAHFIWCICNIRKIHNHEPGYTPQEVEKAMIRIFSGLYDIGIGYLLGSWLMNSLIGRSTFPLVFALLPSYPIQLHHLVFQKAMKTFKEGDQQKNEINHHALEVGCLIQQFCSGLTFSFLPHPAKENPPPSGLWSLPSALGAFFSIQRAKMTR